MSASQHTSEATDCSTRVQQPDAGDRIEIREGYAKVGDQSLHYVEAGDGPLLVLLHGFPSSGSVGGDRSHRSRRRVSGRRARPRVLQPVIEARGLRGLRRRPPRRRHQRLHWRVAPSPRCWSVTTGAEASPGRSRSPPEVVDRLAVINAPSARLSEDAQPNQLRKSWYSSSLRHRATRRRSACEKLALLPPLPA